MKETVFALFVLSRADSHYSSASGGALKSPVSRETAEQVLSAVLPATVLFDPFNASTFCVRKNGVFTGIKVTAALHLSWI